MHEIVISNNKLAINNEELRQAAIKADLATDAMSLPTYKLTLSANTLRAHKLDLATFSDYLNKVHGVTLDTEALMSDTSAWQGVSYGIVDMFVQWMLADGFAVNTVNRKLTTIKIYVKFAYKANVIDEENYRRIRLVKSYSGKIAQRMDTKRVDAGLGTRKSNKKAESNFLSVEQYKQLLDSQPDNNLGLRNKIILGLLFEYGLRVSEVVQLPMSAIDMTKDVMTVYRHKTGETTKFDLLNTPNFYRLLKSYLALCDNNQVYVILPSNVSKNGLAPISRDEDGKAKHMTTAALQTWLTREGKSLGIDNLTPHDLRHSSTQRLIDKNVNDRVLMDFFGWRTRAMIDTYRDKSKIANEGISVL